MNTRIPSLSFRETPKGGKVRNIPLYAPKEVLNNSGHLVLLIHGYNNDLKAAQEAYDGFHAIQSELGVWDTRRPIIGAQLVEVYWPGDANWGIASPIYYPWSIGKAKQTAAKLAYALQLGADQSGFTIVDIIAHSMGCRLTMELINRLLASPNVTVNRVFFMAAAIPTFMVEPENQHELVEAFAKKVVIGGISLYSPDDMVLSLAFPLGQTFGPSGEGLFPTALGHNFCSTAPANIGQHHISQAGHSDYWGWKTDSKEQARQANAFAHSFLGFRGNNKREVTSRIIGERKPEDPRKIQGNDFEDDYGFEW